MSALTDLEQPIKSVALPEFNRRVVARLSGAKEHSGATWDRVYWAFMVRWDDADTVADGWARPWYDKALKEMDADWAFVELWIYVEDLAGIATPTSFAQERSAG